MKQKRPLPIVGILLALILVVALMVACAGPAAAPTTTEPIKLTYGTFVNDSHVCSIIWQSFTEQVTKRTNGMVTFENFYGGTRGKAKEVLPYATEGTNDISVFMTGYYPGAFDLANAVAIPFTGSAADAKSKAYMQLLEEFPDLQKEFTENHNVKLLMPHVFSEVALGTSKEINSVADMKGLKCRAVGYQQTVVSSWGMVPVSLDPTEWYESLQRGVVDGIFGATPGVLGIRAVHEVVDYYYDTGAGGTTLLATIVNLDTWNSLPPQWQKIFEEEAARVMEEEYADVVEAKVLESMQKAIDAGLVAVAMPDALKAELADLALGKVHEEWIADMVEKGYEEKQARKVMARLIELYEKYLLDSTFKDFVALYEIELK